MFNCGVCGYRKGFGETTQLSNCGRKIFRIVFTHCLSVRIGCHLRMASKKTGSESLLFEIRVACARRSSLGTGLQVSPRSSPPTPSRERLSSPCHSTTSYQFLAPFSLSDWYCLGSAEVKCCNMANIALAPAWMVLSHFPLSTMIVVKEVSHFRGNKVILRIYDSETFLLRMKHK